MFQVAVAVGSPAVCPAQAPLEVRLVFGVACWAEFCADGLACTPVVVLVVLVATVIG